MPVLGHVLKRLPPGAAFSAPWRLPDTADDEAFGFERGPDLGDLVALDFDGPIFHRTTDVARRAQFLSRFLDL